MWGLVNNGGLETTEKKGQGAHTSVTSSPSYRRGADLRPLHASHLRAACNNYGDVKIGMLSDAVPSLKI